MNLIILKIYGRTKIETEDGKKIKSSLEHKFLCEDMVMRPLKDIMINKYKLCVIS
jgi:hypothetical protein